LCRQVVEEGKRRSEGARTMTDNEWLALIDRVLA